MHRSSTPPWRVHRRTLKPGRLNTMVGASQDDFVRIEPILQVFCENIFHMGPVGSGHRTKLIYKLHNHGLRSDHFRGHVRLRRH